MAPIAIDLATAQRGLGLDARVLGVTDPAAPALAVESFVRTFDTIGPLRFGWTPRMLDALVEDAPDVVHQHGLFTAQSDFVRRWQRRSEKPVMLAPHGALEPWAWRQSRWKKRLFGAFVERDNLARVACLHAATEQEASNLRDLGFRHPIAVVPNGVPPDAFLPLNGTPPFASMWDAAANRRLLLFMGRLHPKKGLLNLLDAWAMVARERQREDWLLVVAGPDERGHLARLRRKVADLNLTRDVLFTGLLLGHPKRSALHAADAFVLPSFSEGFSVAVLEAMAAGAPIVLTEPCNFDVASLGAGVMAEPSSDSIAEGLRTIVSMSESERAAMGGRARAVVAARYTADRAARDLADVYAWLTGRAARPASVKS
jgi:glycosyltransferase involved in cell wall biosynthesis